MPSFPRRRESTGRFSGILNSEVQVDPSREMVLPIRTVRLRRPVLSSRPQNPLVEDRVETGAATPEKIPEHLKVDA